MLTAKHLCASINKCKQVAFLANKNLSIAIFENNAFKAVQQSAKDTEDI